MSNIVLSPNASGTGIFTVASPNSNTNQTLTLPDNTGTVVSTASSGSVSQSMLAAGVAGTGPSFSAYQSSAQTVSTATWTKISFQTEEWDTDSCFNNSTTFRFTPSVAGYYIVSGGFAISTTATNSILAIYKNGSSIKQIANTNTSSVTTISGSAHIYLNGSTDYIELYVYIGSGQALTATAPATFFQASLVRAA